MLFIFALRNVLRNLRRLAPMMIIIVSVFAVLVIGNAVLNRTINALYSFYAENLTGDLTISSKDKNNFTVFGSDQLLVGQYLIPPTLVDFSGVLSRVESLPSVRSAAGLISSAARVEIGGIKQNSLVFGVDFDAYLQLIPNLKLEAGRLPKTGEPGIVVQLHGWKDAEKLIGENVLLAAGLGRSFTLREVPLRGIISYPVSDKILNTVVLVDAGTARALNGYLDNSGDNSSISKEEQTVFESDFDSLFSFNMDGSKEESSSSGIDPMALFGSDTGGTSAKFESDNSIISANNQNTESDAWNFLLVSLNKRGDIDAVNRALTNAGFNEESGYLIRDWSASVGGSARLAWFLQLMFNIGLIFVSFGAVIIVTNALLLSVLERTGEIGSLRAMGATRIRVSVMIFIETLLVVFGSALIGIFLGSFGLEWLNAEGIVIDNPYIKILFGGKAVRGDITVESIILHLTAAFLLTVVSMLYPLKRALGISPVEAMAE